VIESTFRSSAQANGWNSRVFSRWPPIRELFNALWYTPSLTAQQRQVLRRAVAQLMQKGVEIAESSGCPQFIIEDNSFPSGMQRDLARQWDIGEMVELLSPYADVRVLALYRDPIAMTFAHEAWDGGPRNHAKLVADYLAFLSHKLMQLDPAILKTIRYEDLVDRQETLAAPLADYLDVDIKSVQAGFQQVRKSKKDWKTEMSPENRVWMTEFFDRERLALWPLFTDPRYNIL